MGFIPSKADTSLFYFHKGQHTIFMLVYVDDFIVASSSSDIGAALLCELEKGVCYQGSWQSPLLPWH